MTRSSLVYVVLVVIFLGAVLVASASERIQCTLGVFCGTVTVAPLEEEPIATTTSTAATTTATTTITDTTTIATTTKPAPAATTVVTPVVPAPSVAPPPTVTTITEVTTVTTTVVEEGPTTFSVSAVPLLVGGNVRGGQSVPLSYLQIVNRGPNAARLKGFWVRQYGNAPTQTVIGLSTVDDKGGSRDQVGGIEGSSPFNDGIAFAPTDALFLPGQMRLFTIKGSMSSDLTDYIGTELKIDVTGLQAEDVTFTGPFPIRGTTWTLTQ